MDIGEGELNRLGVIRALPNACGANMLCRAVSSIIVFFSRIHKDFYVPVTLRSNSR